MPKRKPGPPPKAPGDRYRTPVRQLGRVPDDVWERLKAAAAASGQTFTDWAVGHLCKIAERESERK
jgi:hypothetical protein